MHNLSMLEEILPIMSALCSMLLTTYYAQNYVSIIGTCLMSKVKDTLFIIIISKYINMNVKINFCSFDPTYI